MLKRKITQKLMEWKNSDKRKSLIIKGARQVGKTYIVDDFCKSNYENYIYINFEENASYKAIFDGDLEINNIIKQISVFMPKANLIPNKTIIFLDEIQSCPKAITALKFFTIDKRFDVIASGSLLGITFKENISFPVGYVDHLELNSLDFEEFLWAIGIGDSVIDYLHNSFENKKTIDEAIHKQMMEYFKEYIVVGGMPEAVNAFIETNDFSSVLKIQRSIVNEYLNDIAKYAKDSEKVKARECFLSIPKHLAQDHKKFKYSLVSNDGKARKYEGSLMWLYDAGIINYCYNLGNLELPLEGNARTDCFKVYMRDTGLLISMLEEGSQKDILGGNLGIYKGAIYENIIADIFTKSEKKLYYFEYNSTLEIDFIIRYNDKVTAVEVKSADNTKSKSLNSVMTNWKVESGIKLSSKNIGISNNGVVNYPLYMAMFL